MISWHSKSPFWLEFMVIISPYYSMYGGAIGPYSNFYRCFQVNMLIHLLLQANKSWRSYGDVFMMQHDQEVLHDRWLLS